MELIDFGQLAIGGVNLILLVLGWVEAAKRLGISGQGSFIMALVCGVAFGGLWQAMTTGLVPEVALPWIRVVIVGLGGGIAATGLYDIGKRVLTGAQDYTTKLLSGEASGLTTPDFGVRDCCAGSANSKSAPSDDPIWDVPDENETTDTPQPDPPESRDY